MTMLPRCPYCDGPHLIRLRRRAVEWVFSWLKILAFRCDDCARRSRHFLPF